MTTPVEDALARAADTVTKLRAIREEIAALRAGPVAVLATRARSIDPDSVSDLPTATLDIRGALDQLAAALVAIDDAAVCLADLPERLDTPPSLASRVMDPRSRWRR